MLGTTLLPQLCLTLSAADMGGAEDHYTQHGDYKANELVASPAGDETDDFRTCGHIIILQHAADLYLSCVHAPA